MNISLNYKCVCRTAPITPDLLNIIFFLWWKTQPLAVLALCYFRWTFFINSFMCETVFVYPVRGPDKNVFLMKKKTKLNLFSSLRGLWWTKWSDLMDLLEGLRDSKKKCRIFSAQVLTFFRRGWVGTMGHLRSHTMKTYCLKWHHPYHHHHHHQHTYKLNKK